MSWILYTITAYAAIGISNVLDKILVDKYIKNSTIVVLFTGFVGFLLGIILFVVRGFPVFPLNQVLIALGAGILIELYLIPYFKAMEIDDPSRIVPYFQMVPVFTLLLSFIFLHELLSVKQMIGSLCIIGSGFVLSLDSIGSKFTFSKSFWYMAVASLLLASSMVLFRFVASIQNTWDSLAYENLGIGIGTVLLAMRGKYMAEFIRFARQTPTAGWVSLGMSESFYVIYRVLLGFALAVGSAGLVSVLSGFQPLFVFVYGYILTVTVPKLLKEDVSKKIVQKKIFSIVIIFMGLFLIYV